MKKQTLYLLSFILLSHTLFAKDPQQNISSSIHKVVVFLNGAEINRSSEFQLPKGRTDLRIQGLSQDIHAKSIQASISGNTRILSITSEENFLSNQQNIQKVQVLQDSLEMIVHEMERLKAKIKNIDDQRVMIMSNKNRLGDNGGVSVTELESAFLFFEKRLDENLNKKFSTKLTLNKLTESYNQITQQLQHDQTLKERPNTIVTIKVDATQSQMVKLDFSYAVSTAGWAPKYNLRAFGIEKPISFEYMAKVYNNTSIEWKNVDIELSTGDLFKSLQAPELKKAWTLSENNKNSDSALELEGKLSTKLIKQDKNIAMDSVNIQKAKNVTVSQLAVNFTIQGKYDIPADNQPYLVDVHTYELPASYKYYAIPKLNYKAFLLANITKWEQINIIDSPANIYYNGKYVGESYINTSTATDTLSISLGSDSKINISRVKKEDFSKKRLIGLNRKQSFEYEMVIRNTYNVPIQIQIVDQVPIALESDIEVSLENISNAEHILKTGRLTWNLTIPPIQNKKLTVAFFIKFPRNKRLIISPFYRHSVCATYI